MAAKKTVKITVLVDKVNQMNRESTCLPEHRSGWNGFLEHILMETGQYNGFGYLQGLEVPEGQLPGMIFDHSGEHKHQFPDESRRVYYMKKR